MTLRTDFPSIEEIKTFVNDSTKNMMIGDVTPILLLGEEGLSYLTPESQQSWRDGRIKTPEFDEVLNRAREYIGFAAMKAIDHRGLSADRSIEHYLSWLFLLADRETYNAWCLVEYAQYGAPMLKAAAEILDVKWPPTGYQNRTFDEDDLQVLSSMAEGKPCHYCVDGYELGCG